jgi:hypothetical protein
MYPIMRPPMGLIKKADPKMTKDFKRLALPASSAASSGGKKTWAMTSYACKNNEVEK